VRDPADQLEASPPEARELHADDDTGRIHQRSEKITRGMRQHAVAARARIQPHRGEQTYAGLFKITEVGRVVDVAQRVHFAPSDIDPGFKRSGRRLNIKGFGRHGQAPKVRPEGPATEVQYNDLLYNGPQ